MGMRQNDRADMCYIEFVGNDIEKYEREEKQKALESLGLPTYWDWENKLLLQEQEYFKAKIEGLKGAMDKELVEKTAKAEGKIGEKIRKDIETRFVKNRKFLEGQLKRAETEHLIHMRQESSKKYEKIYENYALNDDIHTKLMKRV